MSSPSPFPPPSGREVQPFGALRPLPIAVSENARTQSIAALNALLADTLTLRDLYKKSHWQASGAQFYQLHLLYDTHYGEQAELADTLAERVMSLGGVSLAMGGDAAAATRIPAPPKGKEAAADQLRRLLQAHETVLAAAHPAAADAGQAGDDGTNDVIVSEVIRLNEKQSWFVAEHLEASR